MGKYKGKGSFIWKYKGNGFTNEVVAKKGWSLARGSFT